MSGAVLYSAFRGSDRFNHLYEVCGTMTVQHDDGTVGCSTLVKALCRADGFRKWCPDGLMESRFPPADDPSSPAWCPDCRGVLAPPADTPSLLDLLEVER